MFTLVFTLMAGFVVVVAYTATTHQGHVLLTGPSVGQQRAIAAGLPGPPAAQGGNGGVIAEHTAARNGSSSASIWHAGHPPARALDARLAAALRPVLGSHLGRLAVGVVDLRTGAMVGYDADVKIRGGGVVTADILAALLLQHQEARTPVSYREAELAADMIEYGSESAATQLWSLVGGARGLAAANATLKLRGTIPAPRDWTWTSTTVADQLQLLADLVEPSSPLGPAARDYALGLMTDVVAGQRWGVPAAASAGTTAAGTDGRLVGPAWVVGSIGVIQRDGHDLLVAVLSDRNPVEAPAVTAVQAAVLKAVGIVG